MTTLFSFLGLGALGALVVGVVALARGRLGWARIRNRRTAAGVTVAAVIVIGVSAALTPTDDADGGADKAVVAAAESSGRSSLLLATAPAPSPSGTITPTPTATSAVPTVPAVSTTFVQQAPLSTAVAQPPSRPGTRPTTQPPAALQPPPAAANPPPAQQPPPAAANPLPAAAPPAQPPAANPRAGCSSSYPDVCLRTDAGDYDCEGGTGNGPNYVRGPLRVTPPDPFKLDGDGNGYGCEG